MNEADLVSHDNPDSLADMEKTARNTHRNLSNRFSQTDTGRQMSDPPVSDLTPALQTTDPQKVYADQVIESYEPFQSVSSVHLNGAQELLLQREYDYSKTPEKRLVKPQPWLLKPKPTGVLRKSSQSREREILLLAAKKKMENTAAASGPPASPRLAKPRVVLNPMQGLESAMIESTEWDSKVVTRRGYTMKKFDPLSMRRNFIKDPYLVSAEPDPKDSPFNVRTESPLPQSGFVSSGKQQLTNLLLEGDEFNQSNRQMRLSRMSRKSELAKTFSQLGQPAKRPKPQQEQDWKNYKHIPLLDTINKTVLPNMAVHSKLVRHHKEAVLDMQKAVLEVQHYLQKPQAVLCKPVDDAKPKQLPKVARLFQNRSMEITDPGQSKIRQNKSMTRLDKPNALKLFTKKSSSFVYPKDDTSSSSIAEEFMMPGKLDPSIGEFGETKLWYTKVNKRKKDLSRDLSENRKLRFKSVDNSLQDWDGDDKRLRPLMQDYNEYYRSKPKAPKSKHNMSMHVNLLADGDSFEEADSISAAVKDDIQNVLASDAKLPQEDEGDLNQEHADKVHIKSLQAISDRKGGNFSTNVRS